MFKHKKTEKGEIIKEGIMAGFLEVIYIVLVAGFFLIAGFIFPPLSGAVIFIPIVFLIILVVSATVSGVLIFGYPAFYFLNKEYQKAFTFLGGALLALLAVFCFLIFGQMIFSVI